MVFAISFGHWVKNVWPSIKNFFGNVVKMCILAVQSNILKKRFYDFFFICCPWVKNLVFYPKISARLSKLRYTGPMGSFEENMLCCWRNWFSQTVFDIEWKNCAWMAKTFRQSCENCVFSVYRIILRRNIYSESVFVFFCFLRVQGKIWGKIFVFREKQFFNVLWQWAKKFRPQARKFFLEDC